MKTFLLLIAAVATVVLGSCAGLPPPEAETNCLVVGYLAEDYPDGFFQLGPRTVRHGLNLQLVNRTRNKKFSLRTNNGYFYFVSNGTDEYTLESYQYEVEEGGLGTFHGGGKVDLRFRATPGKVFYLGHVTVVKAKPQYLRESIDSQSRYWTFDVKVDWQWNDEEVWSFIRDRDAETPWLEYSLVRFSR